MLSAESVHCRYNGTVVLEGATVPVSPGEFVAVIGPNGAGKSTLLRAMSRALKPGAGRVLLDGRDLYEVDARTAARSIAVLPQESGLEFDFSCHDIVMMGRHPHLGRFDTERPADHEAVRHAMDRTSTWELRDRPVLRLSGGERRRVLIARAFAQEPRFLLLDEPTSHLDIRFQIEILGMVKRHGAAVVAVLHDLNLVSAYATRVVALAGGRVTADGPPGEVLREPVLEGLFGPRVRIVDGLIVPRVDA